MAFNFAGSSPPSVLLHVDASQNCRHARVADAPRRKRGVFHAHHLRVRDVHVIAAARGERDTVQPDCTFGHRPANLVQHVRQEIGSQHRERLLQALLDQGGIGIQAFGFPRRSDHFIGQWKIGGDGTRLEQVKLVIRQRPLDIDWFLVIRFHFFEQAGQFQHLCGCDSRFGVVISDGFEWCRPPDSA